MTDVTHVAEMTYTRFWNALVRKKSVERYDYATISAITGIPMGTVKNHILGISSPSAVHFLSYMAAFPDLKYETMQALEPASDECPYETLSELGRGTGLLADALKDGKLDHIERSKLMPLMQRIGSSCLNFARGLV